VLHYRLRIADNAMKGRYNVTLNWNTGDGWAKKEYPIYIDPKSADFVVGALLTSPEKLIADTKQAKLSVNIDNIGKGNAENVKVKLILPSGFKPSYSYSDEDSPGTIAKSSSKTTNFYVDVDETIKEENTMRNLRSPTGMRMMKRTLTTQRRLTFLYPSNLPLPGSRIDNDKSC